MELIKIHADSFLHNLTIAPEYRMDSQISKPLLVYDGNCDFCIFWINRWKHLTQDRIEYVPYQTVSHHFSDIPISVFQTSVQYILENGQNYSGAEAIFRALNNRKLIWFYEKCPGFGVVTEFVYNFVAKRRVFFSKLTRRFFRSYSI